MTQSQKGNWTYRDILVLTLLLIITIGIFFVIYRMSYDPYKGVDPDIGKQLHEEGRPIEWCPTFISLGDTGFEASVGPAMYTDDNNQDWDYYWIDIERPIGDSSYVFFERELKISDIPAEIVNKTAKDIVKFDENSRVVTFILGDKTYIYELPDL